MLSPVVRYEEFVERNGSRLRAALVAAYGPDVGADAAAEALAYGFEHWPELSSMANPAGYLYRVGQSEARRHFRPPVYLPPVAAPGLPDFEPGLAPALEALTESQRIGVVLVHALGWPLVDAAEVLGVDVSTLRTHIARGLSKLRTSLEVTLDVP
jgi:DNA-directed RNA polymerase specialized sigma24 family protein